ncbi:hypothetical protein BB560_004567 [Smittium megazygosporum]|uniref:Pre-mRNA polyadenylation factor Fip1 domain-containing protein n=1 Tax=Smittium megazygosporum TaxID=133381 RepID=A0A2T9Z8V8_9FUNG|nr:hypothetical protein BB560_004567 [Smittium megazygosporum]
MDADFSDEDAFLYGDNPPQSIADPNTTNNETNEIQEVPLEANIEDVNLPFQTDETEIIVQEPIIKTPPKIDHIPEINIHQETQENNLNLGNDSSDDDIDFIFGDSVGPANPSEPTGEESKDNKNSEGKKLVGKYPSILEFIAPEASLFVIYFYLIMNDLNQVLKVQEGQLDLLNAPNIEDVLIYDYDLGVGAEKPWLKPGADITDYFNFGFTEQTWKLYCVKQKVLREKFNPSNIKNLPESLSSHPEISILKPDESKKNFMPIPPLFPGGIQPLSNPPMGPPLMGMGNIPLVPGMPHPMQQRMQPGMPMMMGSMMMPNMNKSVDKPDQQDKPQIKDIAPTFQPERNKPTATPNSSKDLNELPSANQNRSESGKPTDFNKSKEDINNSTPLENEVPEGNPQKSSNTQSPKPPINIPLPPNMIPPVNMAQNPPTRPLNQPMPGLPMGMNFPMNNMMVGGPLNMMNPMGGMNPMVPIQNRQMMPGFPNQMDRMMGFPGQNQKMMFPNPQQQMMMRGMGMQPNLNQQMNLNPGPHGGQNMNPLDPNAALPLNDGTDRRQGSVAQSIEDGRNGSAKYQRGDNRGNFDDNRSTGYPPSNRNFSPQRSNRDFSRDSERHYRDDQNGRQKYSRDERYLSKFVSLTRLTFVQNSN